MLDAPNVNSDEAPSSRGDKPEPPAPTLKHTRRMSSISRSEKDALALSKPAEPLAAPGPAQGSHPVVAAKASMDGATPAVDGVRRVPTENMTGPIRQLFVTPPAYPGGIGGVITYSGSTPSPGAPGTQSFRMVFDRSLPVTPGRGAAMVEMELPVGLEAVREEKGGVLSIRELLPVGSGGVAASGAGGVIARIEALPPSVGGGAGEAVYSVVLGENGGAAEMMAVKVSTHPTTLEAPREVRAVLLLPPRPADPDGKNFAEGKNE